MFWIRRLTAILIGILFGVLLITSILILRVEKTFLNPEFYKHQFEQADLYEFVSTDLVGLGLIELQGKPPIAFTDRISSNPLVDFPVDPDEIASSIEIFFPSTWLRTQVDLLLHSGLDYLAGNQEKLLIDSDISHRLTLFLQDLAVLFLSEHGYATLIDEFVLSEVNEIMKYDRQLPFGIHLTNSDIRSIVTNVLPRSWIEEQLKSGIEQIVPYSVGEVDEFEIHVDLNRRVDLGLVELKALMLNDQADFILGNIAYPELNIATPEMLSAPSRIVIEPELLRKVVLDSIEPKWIEQQIDLIVDELGRYIKEADDLHVVISLENTKEKAGLAAENLVIGRSNQFLIGLVDCSENQQSIASYASMPLEMLICSGNGTLPETVFDELTTGLTTLLRQYISTQIPDELVYTDAELYKWLATRGYTDIPSIIDRSRKIILEGWSYTDSDLRDDLSYRFGGGPIAALDSARNLFQQGWSVSGEPTEEGNSSLEAQLSKLRDQLGRAQSSKLLLYLISIVLLILIGWLGGSTVFSKIAWSSSVVILWSAAIFIVSGPAYQVVFANRLDYLGAAIIGDSQGTHAVVMEKTMHIVSNMSGAFASGVATYSGMLLICGLLMLSGGLALAYLRK